MKALSLREKAKNMSNRNVTVNTIIQNYFFECLLRRITLSKYKNNFVLKGGVLLSNLLGIENRSTMDIDTMLEGIELEKTKILEIMTEIININVADNIIFDIVAIEDIRTADEYGGYKLKLIGKLEGIRQPLSIDIATGDPITPKKIEYTYITQFDDESFNIYAYNIETIISEKLHSLLSRSSVNGRMKDYYDLYYIFKNKKINIDLLKKSVNNTFKYRESLQLLGDFEKIIEQIKTSKEIEIRWKAYQTKKKYASDIIFQDIIKIIEKYLNKLLRS